MRSHLEQVLDCFVRMDVEGLRILLQEPEYYSVPKEIFLERLQEHFEQFVDLDDPENSRLSYFPGACCSRYCDRFPNRLGFKFQGYAGDHFDLRFILEKNDQGEELVKDIFTCYYLITNELIEEENLGACRQFWVYEDDKTWIPKNPDHSLLLHQALEANTQWTERYSQGIVTLLDIQIWMNRYETTYDSIGGFIPSQFLVWKWDNFLRLYFFLDLLIHFLKDFEDDFKRFNQLELSQISNPELAEWIVQLERKIEAHEYWKLHGSLIYRLEPFFHQGQFAFPIEFEAELEETIKMPAENFLKWFYEKRDNLFNYYFALTPSEYDEFLEQNTDKEEEFRVNHLLSYHWDIREKFRKQGVFIPFSLRQPPFNFPGSGLGGD